MQEEFRKRNQEKKQGTPIENSPKKQIQVVLYKKLSGRIKKKSILHCICMYV